MKKLFWIACASMLFLLPSCSKEEPDPCANITCVNGGDCVNGDCLCPPEYTGPDCSQEKPPVKMRVSSIKLTQFPTTRSDGSSWDFSNGPDVYLAIYKNNNFIYSTAYVSNLVTQYTFFNTNVEFSDPTATYTIFVLDKDDFGDDEVIGAISFTPYIPGNDFPTTYPLECSTCVVAFEFIDILYFHV